MKRSISILVISVLLANLAGFYIYTYFRLVEIKKEMQTEIARTSPELFQKIVLSRAEYNLTKEGDDEVEWNDTMYDIASIKFDGDKVEILALPDAFETNLISFLSQLLQSATDDSKTAPSHLLQFLSLTFTATDQAANDITRNISTIRHNTLYQPIESDFFSTICVPPPRS